MSLYNTLYRSYFINEHHDPRRRAAPRSAAAVQLFCVRGGFHLRCVASPKKKKEEGSSHPPASSDCRSARRRWFGSSAHLFLVVLFYRQIMQSVRRLFASRPLLSNCIVYGSLYAGAEFSQQTLIRKILVSRSQTVCFILLMF